MFSWTLHDYRMSSGVRGMLVRPDESFFNAQQAEAAQQSAALKEQVIYTVCATSLLFLSLVARSNFLHAFVLDR